MQFPGIFFFFLFRDELYTETTFEERLDMKTSLVVLGLVVAGISQAVTFDWETLTPGVASSFSQTVGGVTATVTSPGFSVTAMLASGGAANLPFGNVSVAGGVATPSNSWKPIRVDFSMAMSSVTAWFGDNGTDNDGTVFLAGYSNSNTLIATSSIVRGASLPAQSLTVSGTGIAYVLGTTNATTNPHSIVWDNFSAVPEPASMLALGIPALAMLRRNRRNK